MCTCPTVVNQPIIQNQLCPQYHVFIHNDDHNEMDHVVNTLVQIFGFNEQDAFFIMMETHTNGLALVKTEPKEHAEFHQEQLQAAFLVSTIEPAE